MDDFENPKVRRLRAPVASSEKRQAKCECGEELPHHLADLADDRFAHICSCERKYKVEKGEFVLIGTEPNPFARARRSIGKRQEP